VLWSSSNSSPNFSFGGGKIWSRSDTVLWFMRRSRTKLVRCARVREEFQNKEKREGWSEFIGNFVRVCRHLWIDMLECKQPGGGFARVLGWRYA
jgi:hypothetical protein